MSFLIVTSAIILVIVSLFMILLVLIQRGRGGGLAGAFGGMGGQSAFGTRAGDTFTRITIVLAIVWVVLAGGMGMLIRRDARAAATGEATSFTAGQKSGETEEQKDLKAGNDSTGTKDAAEAPKGTTDAEGETKADNKAADGDAKAAEESPDKDDKAAPPKEETGSTEPDAKAESPEPATPPADDSNPAEKSEEKASDVPKTPATPPESPVPGETPPEPLSGDSAPPAETDPK